MMSHTEKITETYEYEVELCDNCGHRKGLHYTEPKDVYDLRGKYIYTACGCMVIRKPGEGRRLPGDNPYLRCNCTKFV